MSSQTLLVPPSLAVPARRRPSLSPTMSSTRSSPYPTSSSAGPSRPGMSRTYSFCATSKNQTYASASTSSKTPVPVHRQQRKVSPTTGVAITNPSPRAQLIAPKMERRISTLGVDGLQSTQLLDGGREQSYANGFGVIDEPSPIEVPCIVIDEPTPRKPTAQRSFQHSNAPVISPTSPYLRDTTFPSPGSPAWSNHSQRSTPGPITPGTPFGLRQYNHATVLVTSHSDIDVESGIDVEDGKSSGSGENVRY